MKKREDEKPCFYCNKSNLTWNEDDIAWILKSVKVCSTCLGLIRIRFGIEKDAPMREPGCDDD